VNSFRRGHVLLIRPEYEDLYKILSASTHKVAVLSPSPRLAQHLFSHQSTSRPPLFTSLPDALPAIDDEWQRDLLCQVLVLVGTTGMGKSMFMAYVLWCILRLQQPDADDLVAKWPICFEGDDVGRSSFRVATGSRASPRRSSIRSQRAIGLRDR
jgi:hypothetical protein